MRANARFCGATLLLATLLLSPTIGQVRPESPQRALVKQYCLTCHSDQAKTGGLTLEQLDIDHPEQQPEVWEKVVRKLRAGLMPPTGAPRPERAPLETLRASLEVSLDRFAATKPNPGATALHRMNRAEYANAVRDLLAVEVDPATILRPTTPLKAWTISPMYLEPPRR